MTDEERAQRRRREVDDARRQVTSLLEQARGVQEVLYAVGVNGATDELTDGLLLGYDEMGAAVAVINRVRVLIRARHPGEDES